MKWPGNSRGARSGQSSDDELRVNVTRNIDIRYEEKEGSHSSGQRDDDEVMTVIEHT